MKLVFQHAPGKYPGRFHFQPIGYSDKQEADFQVLRWLVHSRQNEMNDSIMPTPGLNINMADFQQWQDKAIGAWKQETPRDAGKSRVVTIEDFTTNAWFWAYEHFIDKRLLLLSVVGRVLSGSALGFVGCLCLFDSILECHRQLLPLVKGLSDILFRICLIEIR